MRRLWLAAALIAALCLWAGAVDVDAANAASLDIKGLEQSLPDSAAEILDGLTVTGSLDFNEGLSAIIDGGAGELETVLHSALRRSAVLLAIVLLCAVVGSIRETELGAFPPMYLSLAAVLAITAATMGTVKAFIGLGLDTIGDINAFSKALLPTMAAAMAASGKTLTGSGMYVASSMLGDLFISLVNTVIAPMVYVFAAASAADAAVGGGVMGRVAALVKWLMTTLMKAVLLLFTAYISVSGIISGSADTAAVKAAKVALSGAVPVVGSIISDASETVLVSASILKNAVGVFGMLGVLAMCAVPFLNLGVHYLAYKGTAALSAAIGGGTETKLIDAIGSAMGMILGMTAVCALMLLVSCVAAIKAVTG